MLKAAGFEVQCLYYYYIISRPDICIIRLPIFPSLKILRYSCALGCVRAQRANVKEDALAVQWCSHCTMMLSLYYDALTVLWWSHCTMMVSLYYDALTVLWWSHCTMMLSSGAHFVLSSQHRKENFTHRGNTRQDEGQNFITPECNFSKLAGIWQFFLCGCSAQCTTWGPDYSPNELLWQWRALFVRARQTFKKSRVEFV